MTLLTEHIEAGWREVERGEFGRWVAERYLSRPGQSASTIRVEAESSGHLQRAVSLRQSQLTGTEVLIPDVITNDGTAVTDGQHEALKVEGVAVPEAAPVTEPVPNADEVQQAGGEAAPPQAPATEQTSGSEPTPSDTPTSVEPQGGSPASPAEGEQVPTPDDGNPVEGSDVPQPAATE